MANAADWYARKMGKASPSVTERLERQVPANPTGFSRVRSEPQYIPQADPNYEAPYDPNAPQELRAVKSTSGKTHALKTSSECPQCHRGNYTSVGRWAGQEVFRCYDCGFPVAEQMGAGPTGAVSGPPSKAVQIHGISNVQYNPYAPGGAGKG